MNIPTLNRLWPVSLLVLSFAAHAAAPPVRLNTIGFLPDQPKQASIASPCTNFTVIRASDGKTVFSGVISGSRTNTDTSEEIYVADFSAFKKSGVFKLDVLGAGTSAPFRIGRDVYREPFKVVTRGMYLWRCGTAVSATYNGKTFFHAACHTNDAWLDFVGEKRVRKDSTRGWHDAGDYNKYVVNAGVTVGCMFRAWEDFGPAIKKMRLDLPKTGGRLSEFLAELRWETDWLLTMQAPDGSVYHKVTTQRFGGFIMPEAETTNRYFAPWGSAATADFVAMLAMAARHFRPFDRAYAEQCLQAVEKSYQFLKEHPEDHRPNQQGFSTGGYGSSDPDDRLWAAAEMWETTGSADALRDVEERIRSSRPIVDANWDWGNVKNLGVLTYLLSKRPGKDASVLDSVRASLLETADGIVKARDEHGYARPLGTRYYWGCNGGVARQVLVLEAARRISSKPEYRTASLDALGYLFGRNSYGRSFVTGLGFEPPMHPHDRRSGGDNIDDPWPGYLVGGPHPRATSWQDLQDDFRTNEIAINWNGALIYALAAFLDGRLDAK
jgi:endoglucanase